MITESNIYTPEAQSALEIEIDTESKRTNTVDIQPRRGPMFRDDDEATRARADALERQKRDLEEELREKERVIERQREQLQEQEAQLALQKEEQRERKEQPPLQQEVPRDEPLEMPLDEPILQTKTPPRENIGLIFVFFSSLLLLIVLGAQCQTKRPKPAQPTPSIPYLPPLEYHLPDETCRAFCDPNLLISDALLKDCDCEKLGFPKAKTLDQKLETLLKGDRQR